MRQGSRQKRILATAAVAAAVAVAAAPVSAGPNATLTVQVVPGAVSAGQPVLAVATFRNVGAEALPNVVVDLHLPAGLSLAGVPAGCSRPGGSAANVVCSLGDVASGATRSADVSAEVSRNLGSSRSVRVSFALRVGPGRPAPILTGASARVLASSDASNRGSCHRVPSTLTATLDNQVTALPSPPVAAPSLHLPCTPLAVGVEPKPAKGGFVTDVARVTVPTLERPAIVKLTFPDETLPDEKLIDNLPAGAVPSYQNPDPLWRLDQKTGRRYVVPRCRPGPRFPQGWRSCIVSVRSLDTDGDYDTGTITLLVQGAGFGDPAYVG